MYSVNFWFDIRKGVVVQYVGSWVSAGHDIVFDSTLLNPLIRVLVLLIQRGVCIMSMPRKAMKSLGFQGCCLRCDAEDVGGLSRCDVCISNHTSVRNRMVNASPDDKLFQHVKELYSMISEPHKHDHDPIHRNELIYQQELAGNLSGIVKKTEIEDIEELFSKQKQQKRRMLQDLGGKNPWKNNAPSSDVARIIGEETWSDKDGVEVSNYGARTIPSKEIKKVDRSDRLGEDIELTDVVQGKLEDEVNLDLFLENKKIERKKWKDVVSDIDEILDDV